MSSTDYAHLQLLICAMLKSTAGTPEQTDWWSLYNKIAQEAVLHFYAAAPH